ncbi:MAG: DUF1587 domain-containing protein [Bryobacteraceae bacterium]
MSHRPGEKRASLTNCERAKTPAENPAVWEQVIRKLSHRHASLGTAPAVGGEVRATINSLVSAIDQASPNPGRAATFKRLTQFEYHNAIRDLLALEVDVSTLLPTDETSHGFDNVTVGDLSPTLLERYLTAAQKISRLAIGRPMRAPEATLSWFRLTLHRRIG